MYLPPGTLLDVKAEGVLEWLKTETSRDKYHRVFEKQIKQLSMLYFGVDHFITHINMFETIGRIYNMINTSIKKGGNHYFLLVFDLRKKEIIYLDSLNLDKVPVMYRPYIECGIELLQHYYTRNHPEAPGINTWPIKLGKDFHCQRQTGGYNCGVFTMLYADHLTDNLPLHRISPKPFDQEQYRIKIGTAILNKRLPHGIDTLS